MNCPSAIAASGRRAATGFLIGAAVALSLSLLAGLFRLGEDVIDSSMGMFRAIPWVGLIPLFIVWFGIEETPKIALVALGVTYPLYFNIYGGIRSTDAQLVEAGRMMGLGRLGLIRYVILPSALPGALVGLRYALSTAWLALVFAEQINADAGLGYLMSNAQQYFRTDVIVLCLAVYALLGLRLRLRRTGPLAPPADVARQLRGRGVTDERRTAWKSGGFRAPSTATPCCTTSISTSARASSWPCSDTAAAASRRCCASSPASTTRSAARSPCPRAAARPSSRLGCCPG